MTVPFLLQALLLGFQHTFEPDHLAAVSVLATRRRSMRHDLLPILWRSSQWALGHGATLMLMSAAALLFKSSLPERLSHIVELWVIGPVMIGLGLLAMWRGLSLYSHAHVHRHDDAGHGQAGQGHEEHGHEEHGHEGHDLGDGTDHAHAHAPSHPAHTAGAPGHDHLHTHVRGERLTILNRSFGVGMLHGAAGTGGALAVALGLAADSVGMAIAILALESIGVLVAMSGYALLLVLAARRLADRHTMLLRGLNLVIGVLSIVVGVVWLQRAIV